MNESQAIKIIENLSVHDIIKLSINKQLKRKLLIIKMKRKS